MEQYEHIASILALTMGASWASGINLYATMAVLGFAGATGNVELPVDLQILQNPLVITAASVMYVVEFFADKVPGVDTAWDSVHTFIRIPAGALLAAGAVGEAGTGMQLAAALLGGGMATATHATKAGSRIIINASPEPFTNWAASIGEDVVVIGGLWAALQHPWWFLAFMVAFIIFMAWLLPKIWRAIKRVFGWLGRLFGAAPVAEAEPAAAAPPDADPPQASNNQASNNQASNNQATDKMAQLDQVARLKELHESGALTDEEFAQQKRQVLGSPDGKTGEGSENA